MMNWSNVLLAASVALAGCSDSVAQTKHSPRVNACHNQVDALLAQARPGGELGAAMVAYNGHWRPACDAMERK